MKLDENLGMVYISEMTSPEENIVKNLNVCDKNGIFYVEFDSCLQSFGVLNRNSRIYESSNIEECIQSERIQHYLSHGGWYGEMNHPTPEYKDQPLSPERIQDICMGNTSHRMLNPHIEGNLLVSKIQTDAGTDAGLNLAKKMVQGFIPGFSCRAIASLMLKNNKPTVNVRKIITYDWVLFQSHREAEQNTQVKNKFVSKVANTVKEVTEKVGSCTRDVMIPLKEILESVGRRDVNTQVILESFDLTEDNLVGFSKNKKAVIIKDENNTIYCNIDQNSRRRVNEFFKSF
jgi:hypothetical protein